MVESVLKMSPLADCARAAELISASETAAPRSIRVVFFMATPFRFGEGPGVREAPVESLSGFVVRVKVLQES